MPPSPFPFSNPSLVPYLQPLICFLSPSHTLFNSKASFFDYFCYIYVEIYKFNLLSPFFVAYI